MKMRAFMLSVAASLALVGGARAVLADACKHPEQKTTIIKEACASGGQAAAKEAMKKWTKEAKAKKPSLDCKTCHGSLAPGYELKSDGLKLFQELGGK